MLGRSSSYGSCFTHVTWPVTGHSTIFCGQIHLVSTDWKKSIGCAGTWFPACQSKIKKQLRTSVHNPSLGISVMRKGVDLKMPLDMRSSHVFCHGTPKTAKIEDLSYLERRSWIQKFSKRAYTLKDICSRAAMIMFLCNYVFFPLIKRVWIKPHDQWLVPASYFVDGLYLVTV